MYGYSEVSTVNNCRYRMFASKQIQSHCLPSYQDVLKQHTMRANHQTALWRCALVANSDVPSPEGRRRINKEGHIELHWMSLPSAPAALLEMVMCACTGNCSTGHCMCNRNSLSCTDACQCSDQCKTLTMFEKTGENDDDFDDDDEEDDEDE